MSSAAASRPVVIQTLWRTGGTYLAFHLRERNPVALFYEPLHEDYSAHPKSYWDAFASADAGSRRHPGQGYYVADLPFTPEGGVAGHRREFAFERFVLGRGDQHPALSEYLKGLITSAGERRALFKFCRGFLRQPYLQAQLEPATAYIARRPSAMLRSYRQFANGAYFFSAYLRILALNRDAPGLAPLYAFVAERCPELAAANTMILRSDQLFRLTPTDTAADVFLFFWALALAAHTEPDILSLDVARLGAGVRARAECAAALRAHIGLDLDLADAAPLDASDSETLSFSQPNTMRPLLAAAISALAPKLETRAMPETLRPQFEKLVG